MFTYGLYGQIYAERHGDAIGYGTIDLFAQAEQGDRVDKEQQCGAGNLQYITGLARKWWQQRDSDLHTSCMHKTLTRKTHMAKTALKFTVSSCYL